MSGANDTSRTIFDGYALFSSCHTEWKKRDPIPRLKATLQQQQGQLSDDEWEEMDRKILARIENAVGFAKASPFPAPDAALEDVFAETA